MVAYLKKPEGSEGFHQIVDFLNASHIRYALTENPTIYVSLIKQFWQTTTAKTLDNGEIELTATIDGKVKTITEGSVRRHLQLADADGISSLPTTKIFEQLSLMGYVSTSDKLTFQKGHFSPQWRFLIHTILHCLSPKKTSWEQFSSNIATAIICLATNKKFNFSKLIFDGMVKNLDSKHKFLMYPRFIQVFLNKHKRLLQPHTRLYIAPTHTQKLFSNMKRASKGYTRENIPLFPAMIVQGPVVQGEGSTHPVESHHTPTSAPSTSQPPISPTSRRTNRQESVVPQPRSPTQTPVADEAASTGVDVRYGGATTTVTGLEAGQGSGNIDKTPTMPHDSPLPRKVESLETDLKQTKQIYGAAYTKLIKKVKKLEKIVKSNQARRMAKIVISNNEDDLEDPSKHGRKITNIDQDPGISLVQHDVEIQRRYEHDMEFDFVFDAAKEVSTAEKDVSTAEQVSTTGVAVTTASVAVSTTSPTRNIRVSTADDITMAETLVYIKKSATKDKDKGKMDESKTVKTKTKLQQEQERLDFEAAMRLQAELDEKERQRIARVHEVASSFNVEEWEDIQARVEVDEELVQRLQAEEREKYTEVKQALNQRKWYFAAKRAEERRNKPPIQAQQRTYMSNYIKHIRGYTLQQLRESEVDRVVLELAAGSSKRAAEEELDQESTRNYWKIIRVGNHTEVHHFFDDILKAFDRDDLVMLWSLVKEKFNSTEPTDDKEREIWVELKRLFKPDTDDELWKLQKHIHDLTWNLYDSCGVHHVSIEKGIDIYMLVEKEYLLSRGTLTLMLVAKLLVDQDNKMSRELLRKIFMQAEIPKR
ncbi:hypothetical protein Tco_1146461 [Tanacetum coccineum]